MLMPDDDSDTSQAESFVATADIEALPDDQQLAFYGAMFAMSGVDDDVDRRELFTIFEMLDGDRLSGEAQEELRSYAVDPPDLETCLDRLADTDEEIRCAAMLNLLEVALADDIVVDAEDEALDRAQQRLAISDQRRAELEELAEQTTDFEIGMARGDE